MRKNEIRTTYASSRSPIDWQLHEKPNEGNDARIARP